MLEKPFGLPAPFAEPVRYLGSQFGESPYYTESHRVFREKSRKFVEDEIIPFVSTWEKNKHIPAPVYEAAFKAGLLPCVVGPKGYSVAGIPEPPGFDIFHELIFIDELATCGSGGVLWGLIEGLQIGLPPILNFGLKNKEKGLQVARACLRGQKRICLCITEPGAGSDVAGIKTSARLEGDFYVVNGDKKWITNGIFSDYFTVAVKTQGAAGQFNQMSLLLLEKSFAGITCKPMDCQGVHASGTTYISFHNVKVPLENLIGEVNQGFPQIMSNFNHERWGFIVQANRFSRVCLAESLAYVQKRKTFGSLLKDSQVIRAKLGHMIQQVESCHAWLESISYTMMTLTRKPESPEKQKINEALLGGILALCKAHSSKVFELCAREASQIFGGNSYTKTGLGATVERLYRDVRAYAIPGGSEEILIDFGVRQGDRYLSKL